jgi:hypothetical protein
MFHPGDALRYGATRLLVLTASNRLPPEEPLIS